MHDLKTIQRLNAQAAERERAKLETYNEYAERVRAEVRAELEAERAENEK